MISTWARLNLDVARPAKSQTYTVVLYLCLKSAAFNKMLFVMLDKHATLAEND